MERTYLAIKLLARFGWLRAHELGLFLYPAPGASIHSRRTITRRAINWLKETKQVDSRKLPGGSEAIFLTARGANFAQELGEAPFKFFHLRTVASDWKHDCYVAQMLYAMSGGNIDRVVTEFQILSIDGPNVKRPDGLIYFNNQWHLVEVENARKSGPHLRHQAVRVERALLDSADYVGHDITGAALCYPTNTTGINHRTRLVNSLHITDLRGTDAPNLMLIGFNISSPAHAIVSLTTQQDQFIHTTLKIERGLPPEVPTGQQRGPRKQFQPNDIDLNRSNDESKTLYFSLRNLITLLEWEEDEGEIRAIQIEIDGVSAARLEFEYVLSLDGALAKAFSVLNRFRQEEDGSFVPPHRCIH